MHHPQFSHSSNRLLKQLVVKGLTDFCKQLISKHVLHQDDDGYYWQEPLLQNGLKFKITADGEPAKTEQEQEQEQAYILNITLKSTSLLTFYVNAKMEESKLRLKLTTRTRTRTRTSEATNTVQEQQIITALQQDFFIKNPTTAQSRRYEPPVVQLLVDTAGNSWIADDQHYTQLGKYNCARIPTLTSTASPISGVGEDEDDSGADDVHLLPQTSPTNHDLVPLSNEWLPLTQDQLHSLDSKMLYCALLDEQRAEREQQTKTCFAQWLCCCCSRTAASQIISALNRITMSVSADDDQLSDFSTTSTRSTDEIALSQRAWTAATAVKNINISSLLNQRPDHPLIHRLPPLQLSDDEAYNRLYAGAGKSRAHAQLFEKAGLGSSPKTKKRAFAFTIVESVEYFLRLSQTQQQTFLKDPNRMIEVMALLRCALTTTDSTIKELADAVLAVQNQEGQPLVAATIREVFCALDPEYEVSPARGGGEGTGTGTGGTKVEEEEEEEEEKKYLMETLLTLVFTKEESNDPAFEEKFKAIHDSISLYQTTFHTLLIKTALNAIQNEQHIQPHIAAIIKTALVSPGLPATKLNMHQATARELFSNDSDEEEKSSSEGQNVDTDTNALLSAIRDAQPIHEHAAPRSIIR